MPLPSAAEDAEIRPQIELLHSLQSTVESQLSLLAPLDKAWQPTDFLPDLSAEDWRDQLERFREPAKQVSDEILVVIVGDMVTEEALPNYSVTLNLVAQDRTGQSPDPWARWLRGWTGEENRHGDLLNAYLRLTGRVDMHAVELTVHHLLVGGFDPRAYPDPYAGMIYPSFQERATRISHSNAAKLAARDGDENLARICRKIAGDESRHEQFYVRMVNEVMNLDPERCILSFRQMLRRIISMPGRMMYDGQDPDLFEHFAAIAQRVGVYTAHDYAGIIDYLVKTWDVAHRPVSGKAAKAQEFLCVQAERLGALAEEITAHAAKQPPTKFSWIHGRSA
jgi:acyl-[acyl-carrier-protein] desaturase